MQRIMELKYERFKVMCNGDEICKEALKDLLRVMY